MSMKLTGMRKIDDAEMRTLTPGIWVSVMDIDDTCIITGEVVAGGQVSIFITDGKHPGMTFSYDELAALKVYTEDNNRGTDNNA